jgi:fructose/tagatose bisphosphate aldolase
MLSALSAILAGIEMFCAVFAVLHHSSSPVIIAALAGLALFFSLASIVIAIKEG